MAEDNVYEITTYVDNSPAGMMRTALEAGKDLEKMEKWLDLQIRWEENEAKKAFYKAKAAFKANAPTVYKDKDNKQYNSRYASESAMMNTMNPVLSEHGLEASFDYPKSDDPKMVMATCHLSHEDGYRESVTLSGPVDTSGSKNPIQQIKSTITYLKKATYEAVLGIASSDAVDDDGNGNVEVSFLTGKDLADLKKLHDEVVTKPALFLKAAKIKSLDDIPENRYLEVLELLNQRKVKMAKAKVERELGCDDA